MEPFTVKHDMVYAIAKVCHQANQAFRDVLGEDPGPSWAQCSDEQKAVTMSGVEAIMADSRITAADLHQNWFDDMARDGWTYGPVKDPGKKTHPCMVEYHELPVTQQYKDKLFSSVTHALMYDVSTNTNDITQEDTDGH